MTTNNKKICDQCGKPTRKPHIIPGETIEKPAKMVCHKCWYHHNTHFRCINCGEERCFSTDFPVWETSKQGMLYFCNKECYKKWKKENKNGKRNKITNN